MESPWVDFPLTDLRVRAALSGLRLTVSEWSPDLLIDDFEASGWREEEQLPSFLGV